MSRLDRSIALLALLATGLLAWDRALVRAEARRRAEHGRVGKLLPPERRAELRVAAVRVELPDGGDHLYARYQGRWRALDHALAPADPEKVGALVESLKEAEGVLRSRDPEEAALYGVDARTRIRVSLCGPRVLEDPGRDTLEAFDVGLALAEGHGSFLRRVGSAEVWAVDANPRALLEERAAPGLPPLLEPGVVARAWEGWPGLARLSVRPAGNAPYDLLREPREVTPEELQAGTRPWRWLRTRPGATGPEGGVPVDDEEADRYLSFLRKVPYLDVLPPERRSELVPEPSAAAVELVGADAEGETHTLLLEVGAAVPGADGIATWNADAGSLYVVRPDDARRIAPPPPAPAEGPPEPPDEH